MLIPQQSERRATEPAPAQPAVREAMRVIIYGKSGCPACMDAIQDLMDRQVSFTYFDVSKDQRAMTHLKAICGAGEAVVPVIIQIGYGGA
ncbi:MAG TPA: glutaredoxin domain-containing protein [Symbiobacteriaceae bacterium]|nr:glutaredoxin domain-containing protein [Symbiobacteriaceae bacterium]